IPDAGNHGSGDHVRPWITLRPRVLRITILIDGYRQPRLQHDDGVERPASQKRSLETLAVTHPGKLIEVAEYEAQPLIDVGPAVVPRAVARILHYVLAISGAFVGAVRDRIRALVGEGPVERQSAGQTLLEARLERVVIAAGPTLQATDGPQRKQRAGIAGIDVVLIGSAALDGARPRIRVVKIRHRVFQVRGGTADITHGGHPTVPPTFLDLGRPLPDVVVLIERTPVGLQVTEHHQRGRSAGYGRA